MSKLKKGLSMKYAKSAPPLIDILGVRPTKGDVGLEIEVEGRKLPREGLPPMWGYHSDGSLRGDENAEYVLAKPLPFKEVPNALAALWDVFSANKSRLDDSNRTSVHVHLNAQQFGFNRLASFLCMYFAVEEALTEWCGEHRVGNLFCLRAKDAPAIVTLARNYIRNLGRYPIGDNYHYSAMNLHALQKFGSLEVRTLRGVSDPRIIEDWVSILERLYNLSADYEDPRSVIERFSGGGPLSFFEDILGDKAKLIIDGSGMSVPALKDSLYEGIRFAQDVAYCRDWTGFKTEKAKRDPFGRKTAASPTLQTFAAGWQSVPLGSVEPYTLNTAPPIVSAMAQAEVDALHQFLSVDEADQF